MDRRLQRNWRIFGVAFLALLASVATVRAATINLTGYVTFALLQNDGVTPLVDGSIVQIIGSSNNLAEPMAFAGTNLVANPVPDDILLATITIDSTALASNGTFFVNNVFFQSDQVNYIYIRFFDTTGPLTGQIAWGESPLFSATNHQFGSLELDFIGDYAATNINNFGVIPEPGTGNLMLVWLGMIAAMRASIRGSRKKENAPAKTGTENAQPIVENTYDRF